MGMLCYLFLFHHAILKLAEVDDMMMRGKWNGDSITKACFYNIRTTMKC